MKVREQTCRVSPHLWVLGLLEENDCFLRHTKEQGDTKGEGVCGGEQRLSLQDRTVSYGLKMRAERGLQVTATLDVTFSPQNQNHGCLMPTLSVLDMDLCAPPALRKQNLSQACGENKEEAQSGQRIQESVMHPWPTPEGERDEGKTVY